MSLWEKIKDALTTDDAEAAAEKAGIDTTDEAAKSAAVDAENEAIAAEANANAEAEAAQAKAEARARKAAEKADARAKARREARKHKEYVVKSGDTLSEIGARFGVDWRDIARINHIENPDLIFPGQKFKIPNKRSLAPSKSLAPGFPGASTVFGDGANDRPRLASW